LNAKVRLESEKFDLTELLDKRNREVDRLTGEIRAELCSHLAYIQHSEVFWQKRA